MTSVAYLDAGDKGVFIGGTWQEPEGGVFDDINPHNAVRIADAPDANTAQMTAAIAAARHAADTGPWAESLELRAQCLHQLGDALERHADEFAALGAREWGATPQDRPSQIDYAAGLAHENAELITKAFEEESLSRPEWGLEAFAMRDPIGVVAAIIPWNFPHTIGVMQLSAALAAGNSVVLKPSPLSPLSGLALAKLIDEETDIPAGVVNVVTTASMEATQLLTTDERVDMVSFTGSPATGKKVMAAASGTLKRVLLELGGKSAMVVLDDADLDAIMPQLIIDSCTFHAGQACLLYSRLLVHEKIYDDFVTRWADLAGKVRIGDPADPSSEMGPMITAEARDRAQRMVDAAVAGGAELVTGGKPPAELSQGFYFEPTLLAQVRNDTPIAREEIFGPVACAIPFTTDEDAVRLANDSDFGLLAGVHGASLERASAVAKRLRAGGVSVGGAPTLGYFGGYKQSGIGRMGGALGIQNFTELKSITRPAG